MVKSNQVQLLSESHTRALVLPQKWPFRAKIKVSQDTPKKLQRSDKRVFRVQGTHLGKNNWKRKKITGFVTRRLYFFQKRTTFWPKFPSWGIWPICEQNLCWQMCRPTHFIESAGLVCSYFAYAFSAIGNLCILILCRYHAMYSALKFKKDNNLFSYQLSQ